jgi:hypothetical protein
MIVVHSVEVSTVSPRVVISSLLSDYRNLLFAILTLPLVYGPEITTYHYKGLLQEYVMLCYGFPHKVAPLVVLRFPAQSDPFCTMWFRRFTKNVTKTGHKDRSHPHSTEHDTQPIAYLISKQVVPYRTCGGTCCPGGCLLLRFGP